MTGISANPVLTEEEFSDALAAAGIATNPDNVTAAYQTARWLAEGTAALAQDEAGESRRDDKISP